MLDFRCNLLSNIQQRVTALPEVVASTWRRSAIMLGSALLSLSTLFLSSTILAADVASATPAEFQIPATTLDDALSKFGAQSGMQVVYAPEIALGLKCGDLSGRLTVEAALKQLLAGTGLSWRYVNDNTIVIEKTSASSRAEELSAPASATTDTMETIELGTVVVTGTRIRRDPMEATVSPVTVFDREQIERSGSQNVADLLGFVTQNQRRALDREVSGDPISGRATIDLRGLGNNTTLVLVNGRRIPKTGQGFGLDAYNLNTIPMAAIERIEVLTNSSSAIYGSDAIGGVVNIITRRDYSGAEVTAHYGDTWRNDSAEQSFNAILGHDGEALGARHYSLTLNLNSYETDGLAAADRAYTASADYSAKGGRALFPPHPLFSRITGAGSVLRLDGMLPGLDTDWVAIPSGQDGRSLTPADFDPATPMGTTQTEIPAYRFVLPPEKQRAGSLSGKLELTERMELFTDLSYSQDRAHAYGVPPSAIIPVPASNPYNPFGVDVLVNKVFYELGPSRKIVESSATSGSLGVRGDLAGWRYEVAADQGRVVERTDGIVPPTINFFPILTPIPGGGFSQEPTPGWTAVNQTDRARALNVFGDGRTTQPNDLALIRSLIAIDKYKEESINTTFSFTADGAIARLPGGDLKLALGGEYRKQRSDFDKVNNTGEQYVSLDEGAKQHSKAGFVECSVPLVGEHQKITGIRSLEASIAGRVDSESFLGSEFTPKFGLLWKPATSLSLRASYSRGYKVPSIQQLLMPETTFDQYLDVTDPITGEAIGMVKVRLGGHKDLEPERSSSLSAGFVYEPSWLRDFSLSIDYFDITYENKVVGPFVDAEAILLYVPERIERDSQTNRITLIDARTLNLSSASARGVDLKGTYKLQTGRYGAFDTSLSYTYNIENTEQVAPRTPVMERVDETVPHARASASLFWSRGAFELGTNANYESSSRNIFHRIWGVQPRRVQNGVSVDLQGSINLAALLRRGSTPVWSRGAKVTVGVLNVFDQEPSPIDGNGGYAKLDPRQRRFYLTVKKAF